MRGTSGSALRFFTRPTRLASAARSSLLITLADMTNNCSGYIESGSLVCYEARKVFEERIFLIE